MYEHLAGKKILIIGSDATNVVVVLVAQELGMYTIVADGICDEEKAPAKKIADEAWDIDYSKTDVMAKKALERGVNGVFAGYSEHRVLAALHIAKSLGLPFYATEEQINLTRNKRFFKDECIKYGIKVPKDYCLEYPVKRKDIDLIEYPVIVKPADYGGRKGITICYDSKNIEDAISYAISFSKSKMIIIEELLEGTEFSAIYTIVDGQITLSCVNEKYISNDQDRQSGLCEFVITPASFLHSFNSEANDKVVGFLKGIKARNGVAFFQGMHTPKGIYIFEMGYRVNGNNDFYVIEKNNQVSFLKMLLNFSITGSMGEGQEKDNPFFKNFFATMPLNVHKGTVAFIEYSKLRNDPRFEDIQCLIQAGQHIVEDGSTQQKAMAIRMSADTVEEIIECIEFVNSSVKILDCEQNNMLFKPFDYNRIISSYKLECGDAQSQ